MPFSGDDDHQTLVKVAKAEWDFDDECFDDLSHDAMEFIERLLVKEPRYEITPPYRHFATCGHLFVSVTLFSLSQTKAHTVIIFVKRDL